MPRRQHLSCTNRRALSEVSACLGSSRFKCLGPGQSLLYSDWLRAGCYVDRVPVGERFSLPMWIDPGALSTSCMMGTGYLSKGKAAEAWR